MGHISVLALTFFCAVFVSLAALPSAHAQFGGSDPSLAGPYFVRGNDGRTCIYYRIRNFAIRGFNTQSVSNIKSPSECARLCNDQTWCNSFEYSADGRCNVNANDIYVPETITAWNTAFDWDYWQLRDCVPAGSAGTGFASPQQPPVAGGAPQSFAPPTPDTLAADPLLPPPVAPGTGDNNQNNRNAGTAQINLTNGQNRGSQRVQQQQPVRNIPGFPSVSATPPPPADASGARVQNQ